MDERKERKESTNGRALHIGKGYTGAFEFYNIENGKKYFYRRYFFFIKPFSRVPNEKLHSTYMFNECIDYIYFSKYS